MSNNSISKERKQYLKKQKTNKIAVFFTQIGVLVGLLALWEYLANIGVMDSFITSSPSRIWNTFMNLSSNELLEHVKVTCFETIVGFLSGTILGFFVAILLWWSPFFSKVAEPYLVVLNSLPKIALRTCHYNLGRSRYTSNYCNGTCDFFNCNHSRNFKWFFKNR